MSVYPHHRCKDARIKNEKGTKLNLERANKGKLTFFSDFCHCQASHFHKLTRFAHSGDAARKEKFLFEKFSNYEKLSSI
jgi:hypothetical protein